MAEVALIGESRVVTKIFFHFRRWVTVTYSLMETPDPFSLP